MNFRRRVPRRFGRANLFASIGSCRSDRCGRIDLQGDVARRSIVAIFCGIAFAVCLNSCDHGLEATPPGPMGISGRVSFTGEWPPEVGQVAVAVYRRVPQELDDFFALTGADTDVALGAASYDYFVPVEKDGEYEWVVVAWRRQEGFWDFTSLLGCYYAEGDTLPRPVSVSAGRITDEIDISVDLGILKGETVPGIAVCERALPAELLAIRDQGG